MRNSIICKLVNLIATRYSMQNYNAHFRRFFLMIPLLWITFITMAQQTGKITGIVYDESNKGFPGVSIRLGLESATMTNNEGSFSLRIPALVKDSLKISYIGYQTLMIPVSKVKEGMLINMKPVIHQLEDVVIRTVNVAQVIRTAINNIPKNYPQFPFEAHGFYREVGKLDSNYLSFAEAGLLIFNQGYGKNKLKDRIGILKERNLKQVGERAVNNPFGSALKGVPYVILSNDLIKQPGAIFGDKFIKKYDFKLTGSTSVDGEEAFLISFDQKTGIEEAL